MPGSLLDKLAHRLGVSKDRLQLVLAASSEIASIDSPVAVAATATPTPSTMTSDKDERPTREQFASLAGVGITLSEAAKSMRCRGIAFIIGLSNAAM